MTPVDLPNTDEALDTLGLKCPEPVMLIRGRIRKMQAGQTLAVLADDPSTTRDVPSFCRFMDHELVSAQIQQSPYCYVIKKGG